MIDAEQSQALADIVALLEDGQAQSKQSAEGVINQIAGIASIMRDHPHVASVDEIAAAVAKSIGDAIASLPRGAPAPAPVQVQERGWDFEFDVVTDSYGQIVKINGRARKPD